MRHSTQKTGKIHDYPPRTAVREFSTGTYRVERTTATGDANITTTVAALATADVLIAVHCNACESSGRDVSQANLETCHGRHLVLFFFDQKSDYE